MLLPTAVVLSNESRLKLPGPLAGDRQSGAAPARNEQDDLGGGKGFDELLEAYKVRLVEEALARAGGNHRKAADLLGVRRSSLTRMIHRLGIQQ